MENNNHLLYYKKDTEKLYYNTDIFTNKNELDKFDNFKLLLLNLLIIQSH
jgi:hypothetical protein